MTNFSSKNTEGRDEFPDDFKALLLKGYGKLRLAKEKDERSIEEEDLDSLLKQLDS